MLRRAFEQAAATGCEEGVATKDNRLTLIAYGPVIGNVPGSVTRHIQHLKRHADPRKVDGVALGQAMVTCRQLFVCRTVDGCACCTLQFKHAADMVVMVVGE